MFQKVVQVTRENQDTNTIGVICELFVVYHSYITSDLHLFKTFKTLISLHIIK